MLPIADMTGEEDRRLAAVADGVEAFDIDHFDAAAPVRVYLAEMRHLARDVTECGPGAVGDFLEFFLAGFRHRHAQVAHHGAVSARERSEAAKHAGAETGRRLDRHRLQREPVDPVPEKGFEAPHHALAEARAVVDVLGTDIALVARRSLAHGDTGARRAVRADSSSNLASTE